MSLSIYRFTLCNVHVSCTCTCTCINIYSIMFIGTDKFKRIYKPMKIYDLYSIELYVHVHTCLLFTVKY